jgi:hypothetical protein
MPVPDPFDLPVSAPISGTGSLPASTVQAVEGALIQAALGGESWRDIPLQGELVRAYQSRAPDVAAAKALLAAHDPARYGQVEPVRPVPAPMSVTIRIVSAAGQRTGLVFEGQAPPPGGYRDAISDGTGDSTGIGTLPL